MPTFDQLPAEQQAIIELVVQRGRSYDDLADALGITPTRVRELAQEALMELAPATAKRVDAERRPQLADYILGQQSGAEQNATRAHLRRSEAARMWALSLLDSLGDMYENGNLPEIPEGGAAVEDEPPARARRERAPERERERVRDRDRPRERVREREPLRRDRERLSPSAETAVRNRRIAGAVGGLLLLGAVVVAVIMLVGGGGDENKADRAAQPKIVGQLLLNPLQQGTRNQGIAIIAERGNRRDVIVQAKLDPTKKGQAYEVWLYNSPKDAVSVGAQVTDQQGNYQGAGPLPANLGRYRYIDVSLERIDSNAAHSGNSVLRGALADLVTPEEAQRQAQQQGGATGAGGAQPGAGAAPGGAGGAGGQAP